MNNSVRNARNHHSLFAAYRPPWGKHHSAHSDAGGRPRRNARSCLIRARLLTAYSLVHVNSQPLLRTPVTWWISPVAHQARLLRRQARAVMLAARTRPRGRLRTPRPGHRLALVLRVARCRFLPEHTTAVSPVSYT